MLKTLEKNWPYLSILLLLILLAVPFVWPQTASLLGVIAVVISVGALVVFSVAGHVRAYRAGELDRAGLVRNILVDLPGLLLTMAAAALAGRAAGQFAGEAAGKAAENAWPGWGAMTGVLAALLAGMVVGIIVGVLVKGTWGKLVKDRQANPR